MKLFGHAEKQAVEVTLEREQVEPGETVEATIRVTGPADDKTRTAVAKLVATHRWTAKTTDSDGETSLQVNNTVETVAECPLVPPGQPVGPGEYKASLTVPAEACRSVAGVISWSVQGVISHRVRSTTGRADLEVCSAGERHPEIASQPPKLVGPPAFRVDVPVRAVPAGGQIKGTVVVEPSVDVTFKSLRAELRLVRGDGRDVLGKGIQYSVFERHGTADLATGLETPAGETREFPFEFALPADAMATVRSRNTVLTWYVVVIGDRGGLHQNHEVYLPIDVHGPSASVPSSAALPG